MNAKVIQSISERWTQTVNESYSLCNTPMWLVNRFLREIRFLFLPIGDGGEMAKKLPSQCTSIPSHHTTTNTARIRIQWIVTGPWRTLMSFHDLHTLFCIEMRGCAEQNMFLLSSMNSHEVRRPGASWNIYSTHRLKWDCRITCRNDFHGASIAERPLCTPSAENIHSAYTRFAHFQQYSSVPACQGIFSKITLIRARNVWFLVRIACE